MELSVSEIVRATGGVLVAGDDADAPVRGMTWDSRCVQPGCLYVALPGERVDGHDFAADAARAGAACALVTHRVEAPCAQVAVGDTAEALGRLAGAWRDRLEGTVLGLTGSTGKTSTKALVRDVLAAAGTVRATEANQNNEIGAPRTLLGADADTAYTVVEMGMRGLGQITSLCAFSRPDWGLVTNVGESHMELLGSQDNIVKAKAELYRALPEGGIAFVNGADPHAADLCREGGLADGAAAIVYFSGSGPFPADAGLPRAAEAPAVWAEESRLDGAGRPSFRLCARGFAALGNGGADGCAPCRLQVRGLHNVSNACAAAAVGLAAGLPLETCIAALEASRPEGGRQEFLACAGGAVLMNDAYNASPDSMRAALATLAALNVPGRRVAVLGDMGELGPVAADAHRRVGREAAGAGVDLLLCVGELAALIAEGALGAGMAPSAVRRPASLQDALELLVRELGPDDAVLVKASHFMGFEKIVEGLVD